MGFAYHAAPVRSRGRVLLAVVLALVTLSAAGCTGGGGTPPSSPPASSPGPATSNAPVKFKPGEYMYAFGGITASLVLHGSDGTLEIQNQTGGDVGTPVVYVITGDDQRFDGQIAGAAPIPKGGDVTLSVTFPSQVTEKTVGLVILVLGSNNMGAFAPVAEGSSA